MKKLLFSIILAIPFVTNAQDVKIKKHDVFVNDTLYCKINGINVEDPIDDDMVFVILSLQGTPLVRTTRIDTRLLKVEFLSDASKVKVKKVQRFPIADEKEIIKRLYEAKVLQGDTINEAGKQLFISNANAPTGMIQHDKETIAFTEACLNDNDKKNRLLN
ncbi:hypothetical protein [Ferruginibacter albus]|uniref:hypothetical protein n=1 Tax=Ferruginibacter albus TaxID=2875540 RepID=UPI001CC4E4B4|nr:hypothetical protein [Ferruginibacter albus]UAY52471.1 hypothetical protein K9M53_01985 [Ferruginibacter albus]